MPFTYKYPHPAVTVDCVVFALHENDLKTLFIQRKSDPFRDKWAIPGGFVEMDENLEDAARRELREETGIQAAHVEQFHAYGEPGRDPRERVISVAHYTLIRINEQNIRASSDALKVAWFSLRKLPPLAFDHLTIVNTAVERLCSRALSSPAVFELLPSKFKLPQLQVVYETILGQTLDKRNFRKKVLHGAILTPIDEFDHSQHRRPAQLYQFDRRKYQKLHERGFTFELKSEMRRKKRHV